MRVFAHIFLTLAVALNFAASAMPAKACAKPCCMAAVQKELSRGCEGCGPAAKLSAPAKSCCQVAAEGSSSPATLNTALSHQGHAVTAAISGSSGRPVLPDAPLKPGYSFGTFKSPPVYKLTSTYLC